jgi:GNAT superfamily N-acetyltransferase
VGPERPAVDRARIQVRPLGTGDANLLAAFSCGDEDEYRDLNEFLRDDALRLQELHTVSTYLALYDGRLVGYVSVLCDAVRLKGDERRKLQLSGRDHPVVPALKVAKLATCCVTRTTLRGVGTYLMQFAYALAADLGERTGCRLLTIDANPKAVVFYEEKLGFVRNQDKLYDGRTNPSFRLDVFGQKQPDWV